MRFLICVIILLCGAIMKGSAQKVILNSAVDTVDRDNKAAVELWNNYLISNPDSLYNNPFWNAEEKQKYKSYDLLKSEGFISPSLYYWARTSQNIILSISKRGEDLVLKSMFYRQTENSEIVVMAIINILAMKENNKWVLRNYLPIYSKAWINRKIGLINYVYHPQHVFDTEKANSANELLGKLASIFNLEIPAITYYIAANCDEIHRLKGFDYVFSMGALGICAFYDAINHIVYSTSPSGENNQHEIVHVINGQFPNGHGLLLAGIAAYWGGENANFGKPLIYHVKRVNEFLTGHQEVDLNRFTEFYTIDSKTNPQYVLGAVICDEALRKGGLEKLKKMLTGGSSDEELVNVIHKELGIAPNKLNTFFRSRIAEWSRMQSINPIEIKSLGKN